MTAPAFCISRAGKVRDQGWVPNLYHSLTLINQHDVSPLLRLLLTSNSGSTSQRTELVTWPIVRDRTAEVPTRRLMTSRSLSWSISICPSRSTPSTTHCWSTAYSPSSAWSPWHTSRHGLTHTPLDWLR